MREFSFHKICLIALCLSATSAVKGFSENVFSFLISIIISAVLIAAMIIAARLNKSGFCLRVFAFLGLAFSLFYFLIFAQNYMEKGNGCFLITLCFFVPVLYLAKKEKSAVYRISLILFILVAFSAVILVGITSGGNENANFGKDIWGNIFLNVSGIVSGAAAICFCDADKKQAAFGMICGFILCGAYFLISLSGANMQFPPASAVSVYSVGRHFIRLDGLIFGSVYVASVLKFTVCLKVLLHKKRVPLS